MENCSKIRNHVWLIAGFLDLFTLNRFARACKIFSSILHYEAFWEMYYYHQPWTTFALKKEKIPTRKPNATWKQTFIDFKNLVFEKFTVPVRGFNWAINEGILPPKKDIWIQFLIANRGLVLNDQQIAILFKSIKSKEAFAKIFFEEVNVDLPLDLLLRKAAMMIRPVPNTSPELAIDALAYEYSRRVLKATSPDEIKTYSDKIRQALILLLNTERKPNEKPAGPPLSKQEFDEKMSKFLITPELLRGSDKFYENIMALPTQHTRKMTTYEGPLTWSSAGDQIVYCEVKDCSFSAYKDETKETLLRSINFRDVESFSDFILDPKLTKENDELTFSYQGDVWTRTTLRSLKDQITLRVFYALYYNIVLPKLLPW